MKTKKITYDQNRKKQRKTKNRRVKKSKKNIRYETQDVGKTKYDFHLSPSKLILKESQKKKNQIKLKITKNLIEHNHKANGSWKNKFNYRGNDLQQTENIFSHENKSRRIKVNHVHHKIRNKIKRHNIVRKMKAKRDPSIWQKVKHEYENCPSDSSISTGTIASSADYDDDFQICPIAHTSKDQNILIPFVNQKEKLVYNFNHYHSDPIFDDPIESNLHIYVPSFENELNSTDHKDNELMSSIDTDYFSDIADEIWAPEDKGNIDFVFKNIKINHKTQKKHKCLNHNRH